MLAIIGVIAGVAVPRFAGSYNTLRFRKTMSDLVSFLREARIKAMGNAGGYNVTMDLHRGFCWNNDRELFILPENIEIFTDTIESQNERLKILSFFPNGTAIEQKIGFACDNMMAVLHVDSLGGLVYYRMDETMEQVVRYTRSDSEMNKDELEKAIDILTDSDTVTKNEREDRDFDDIKFEEKEDDYDYGIYDEAASFEEDYDDEDLEKE